MTTEHILAIAALLLTAAGLVWAITSAVVKLGFRSGRVEGAQEGSQHEIKEAIVRIDREITRLRDWHHKVGDDPTLPLAQLFHLLEKRLERLETTASRTENKVTGLQVGMNSFLNRIGRGSAIVLDTDNPAPPEIRELLKQYRDGKLPEAERETLSNWLEEVIHDKTAQRSERSAAIHLLAAMEAKKLITT